MTTARRCHSVSPDDQACHLDLGHGPDPHVASPGGRSWTGGIRKRARWSDEPAPTASGEPCRSTSPDGTACTKPRGHQRGKHRANGGRSWTGGIASPAQWVAAESEWDSEAAFLISSRYGI